MEFMLSEKGRRLLVHDNYKFYKQHNTQEGLKWRCVGRKCLAKIYTDENATVMLKTDLNHNHERDTNLKRQVISNSVKRKAMDELAERPQKLIRKEISSAPSGYAEKFNVKDIEYIRKNLSRARRSILPPLPKSITEVHAALASMDIKTHQEEKLLQINDEEKIIVCLSTTSNLKYLCESHTIFIDGTFKYCPKFFFQMFTVHTNENGHYIPLVHFLLPSKSTSTYEIMFKMLSSRCEELELKFEPRKLVADFEVAIHSAIRNIWPTSEIIGCRFHASQSWWKKIQELGLTKDYKDSNSDIGKWLHWSFGLLYLNHEEVAECFVEDLMSDNSTDERVQKYVDYLTDTYVAEEAKFPPLMWASDRIEGERTTNACEAFHSKFNANFSAPNPNIYAFVQVMKQIQVDVCALKNSGNIIKQPNKNLKKKMERMKQKLQNNEISRYEFLKAISYYSSKK